MKKQAMGFYDNEPDRGKTWIDGPATSLYRCQVLIPGQRPMTACVRAINSRQAKLFASRRWGPEAEIKMLGKWR